MPNLFTVVRHLLPMEYQPLSQTSPKVERGANPYSVIANKDNPPTTCHRQDASPAFKYDGRNRVPLSGWCKQETTIM
jgi:hypothetical protein